MTTANTARLGLDREGRERPRFCLRILGAWRLGRSGNEVAVPANRQRLIALLALAGPQNRSLVAGTLWPDRSQAQAQASLRSTLSRLRASGIDLVDAVGDVLRLSPDVSVDARKLLSCAETIVHGVGEQAPPPRTVLQLQQGGDLLAGWYDDWVVAQRERLQQLRLHALEIAGAQLSADGRYAEALEAALATVDIEPLRESAHRAVTQVHLAEGNPVEAVRQFQRYRCLLRRELGIEPSERMLRLVQPFIVNDPAERVPAVPPQRAPEPLTGTRAAAPSARRGRAASFRR